MTVNCISDIHAITTKTGSIVYGLPARKSLKKCKQTVDAETHETVSKIMEWSFIL